MDERLEAVDSRRKEMEKGQSLIFRLQKELHVSVSEKEVKKSKKKNERRGPG